MALGYVQIGSRELDVVVPLLTNINGGDDASAGYTDSDFATHASIRARLIAIGGAYTAAYVDTLGANDLVYALKVAGG